MSAPAYPDGLAATPSRPAGPGPALPAPRPKPYGDPAGWDLARLYSLALGMTAAHPRYFLLPALVESVLALASPLACLLTGPVVALLVVGGTADLLAGETPRLGEVWARYRGRLWPMLGSSLAVGLLTLALMAAGALPGMALVLVPDLPVLARAVALVLGLAGLGAGLLASLAAGYFVMHEVVLMERGTRASLGTSLALVRRAPGAVAATTLANGAINVAAQLGSVVGVVLFGVPLAVAAGVAGASEAALGWLMLPLQVLLTMGAAALANATLMVSTLLYYRERGR